MTLGPPAPAPGPRNTRELKHAAEECSRAGRFAQAVELATRAVLLDPSEPGGRSLLAGLTERRRLVETGRRLRDGPFEFRVGPEVDDEAFRPILALFHEAYSRVCPLIGFWPRTVRVWLHRRTSDAVPATYDSLSDEIVVSLAHLGKLGPERTSRVARRLVVHELTHLAMHQRMGRPRLSSRAYWLMEGLAEHVATDSGPDPAGLVELARQGAYDLDTLARYLSVSADCEPRLRRLAYVQAHQMVERLVALPDGLDRIERMVLDYGRSESDGEVFLATLGTRPAEFLSSVVQGAGPIGRQ